MTETYKPKHKLNLVTEEKFQDNLKNVESLQKESEKDLSDDYKRGYNDGLKEAIRLMNV